MSLDNTDCDNNNRNLFLFHFFWLFHNKKILEIVSISLCYFCLFNFMADGVETDGRRLYFVWIFMTSEIVFEREK
jgi:hypothetical protein